MYRLLAVLLSVLSVQISCISYATAEENNAQRLEEETETPKVINTTPQTNTNASETLNETAPVPAVLTSDNYQLKKDTASTNVGPSGGVADVFMGLSAILGLIVLLAWAAKRLNINNMSQGTALKLQSVLSLGAKEKIVIVEADGHKLLLGVTPNNITLLRQLENKESLQIDEVPMTGTFAKQIKKALSQGKFSEDTKSS